MIGKRAKILSNEQVEELLCFVSTTRHPIRNRVLVLLSLKAGLRAGEIAKLTWPMVLGPQTEISLVIELRDHAAKKNAGRLIPMHPALRDALGRWRDATHAIGPVVRSERGRPMAPVSIVNWFSAAYRHLGFAGCSSHSGRRTFITRAARLRIVRVDPCAMFNCWPGIGRSKQPSDTSTAIPTPSASSSR
jgi:integrase